MKTILFLENGTYGGGSFESMLQLVTHLDRSRFTPVVVFVNKTVFYDRLKEKDILVYVIEDRVYSQTDKSAWQHGYIRLLTSIKQLLPSCTLIIERLLHRSAIHALQQIIHTHGVDLIHCNNQSARDLYGVIVASALGIPCISHLRSARVTTLSAVAVRFLNYHVTLFIANSEFTKKWWSELGIEQEKITVVYNAAPDTPTAVRHVRQELGIDPSVTYVVGCVGNLAEGKGQEFLIRTWTQIVGQEPSILLLLVGDGPRRASLESLVKTLGITKSVRFAGYDSRAKELIAGLDLLVLPSQTETFGRTLLEAMVAGVPVIASRVGGIPEIVQHEHTGLLVEYGNKSSLTQAMLRVLHNPTLSNRLCVEAKKMCEEQFQLDTHIQILLNLYDEILGTRRSSISSPVHSK